MVRLLDPVTFEETAVQLGGLTDGRPAVWTSTTAPTAAFSPLPSSAVSWRGRLDPRLGPGRSGTADPTVDDGSASALSPDGRLLYVGSSNSSPLRGSHHHLRHGDRSAGSFDRTSLSMREGCWSTPPMCWRSAPTVRGSPWAFRTSCSSTPRRSPCSDASEAYRSRSPRSSSPMTARCSPRAPKRARSSCGTWSPAREGEELHGGVGSTRGLAFSPDDATLYSASDDLLVWDLRGDRGLIRRIARALPGDPFSDARGAGARRRGRRLLRQHRSR